MGARQVEATAGAVNHKCVCEHEAIEINRVFSSGILIPQVRRARQASHTAAESKIAAFA